MYSLVIFTDFVFFCINTSMFSKSKIKNRSVNSRRQLALFTYSLGSRLNAVILLSQVLLVTSFLPTMPAATISSQTDTSSLTTVPSPSSPTLTVVPTAPDQPGKRPSCKCHNHNLLTRLHKRITYKQNVFSHSIKVLILRKANPSELCSQRHFNLEISRNICKHVSSYLGQAFFIYSASLVLIIER